MTTKPCPCDPETLDRALAPLKGLRTPQAALAWALWGDEGGGRTLPDVGIDLAWLEE